MTAFEFLKLIGICALGVLGVIYAVIEALHNLGIQVHL